MRTVAVVAAAFGVLASAGYIRPLAQERVEYILPGTPRISAADASRGNSNVPVSSVVVRPSDAPELDSSSTAMPLTSTGIGAPSPLGEIGRFSNRIVPNTPLSVRGGGAGGPASGARKPESLPGSYGSGGSPGFDRPSSYPPRKTPGEQPRRSAASTARLDPRNARRRA